VKLPKQARPVMRNPLSIPRSSAHAREGVRPQALNLLPKAIITALSVEHAVVRINPNVQCLGAIVGILDSYEQCITKGRSNEKGCAKNAARHIKEFACKSYCTCS
jgi:hypothetical protein